MREVICLKKSALDFAGNFFLYSLLAKLEISSTYSIQSVREDCLSCFPAPFFILSFLFFFLLVTINCLC